MKPIIASALLAALAPVAATAQDALPAFADQQPPPAPDYSMPYAWAATSGAPGAAAIVPEGASPMAQDAPADVFFIYPTTSAARDRWNDDVADRRLNAWTDMSSIARQASIFNGCCRVFAPRYRQASFIDQNGERELALALAYEDIDAAFSYFLEHHSNGRPFIIAGHSQGGYLVADLLEKRINGTPLADRMVAAYAVGMAVAEGEAAARFADIPVCAAASQTGCFVQWNAVTPEMDVDFMAERMEAFFVERYGEDAPGRQIVCNNPVSFDADVPATTATQSLGAVPGDPGAAPVLPVVAGKVAARCQRGVLVVEADPSLHLEPLGGGVMHYHDLGLFYEDVRQNAVARVNAFLAKDEAAH